MSIQISGQVIAADPANLMLADLARRLPAVEGPGAENPGRVRLAVLTGMEAACPLCALLLYSAVRSHSLRRVI